MPKKIRETPLYIAYNILAVKNSDGTYSVKDESNNESLNPNDCNDKIKIYERQVSGWFLDPAEILVKDEINGFLVLMICLSYLEGVEEYRTGISSYNKSKVYFRNAFQRIYNNIFDDKDLDSLYTEARCGLFHNGMIKGKTIVSYDYADSLNFVDENTIKINPKMLLDDIKRDFANFIELLKTNQLACENFNKRYTNIID